MRFNSIEEYIKSLNEIQKKYICEFINFMKNEFPNIKPKICFAMPMWWVGEKMHNGYVAISSAKEHYSIHFHDESYVSKLKEMLPNCTFGKRCINIRYGDEESVEIVKKNANKYFNSIL